MIEQVEYKALPPASSAGPQPYDATSDAQALDALPLQDYSSAWEKEPDPAPEPPPAPEGAPEGAKEDAPDVEASAREFLELYDMAQSWGFHFYSGRAPESFALPKFAKDRAAHHLAKGLKSMGSPEVAWWMGLLIALGPPAFFNYMGARQYRAEQQEREEAEARRAEQFQAHTPDHITKADGTRVDMPPVPRPEPKAKPRRTGSQARPMGQCEECGMPSKPGRKTCGQQCSGKRTARLRREKKGQSQ